MGRGSWHELFEGDEPLVGEPPADLTQAEWTGLATHIARAERVREMVERDGRAVAEQKFAASPHAVERAYLVGESLDGDLATMVGILSCAIDEWLAYGQFLSRLVELGAAADPRGTVASYEQFVAAAERLPSAQPSWPERVRVARDGLAALYVRVGRPDDAERVYLERFAEEPKDVTVVIGAARAFLEVADHGRAVSWLERAISRAVQLGRTDLIERLRARVTAVRKRMN